ncbi:interleukin-1 receptor-associated kinase-like 2 [Striga asiatica]|uniref:Interleukin-1 receptor-associated kinase-like 2 n=1 Tax=Striga asiatica TaxID=4170 RepID=A0A5A7QN31_STRAF|nr:interleukin-1 receptor-associated kinase-like 2 [Striga asiatica]
MGGCRPSKMRMPADCVFVYVTLCVCVRRRNTDVWWLCGGDGRFTGRRSEMRMSVDCAFVYKSAVLIIGLGRDNRKSGPDDEVGSASDEVGRKVTDLEWLLKSVKRTVRDSHYR